MIRKYIGLLVLNLLAVSCIYAATPTKVSLKITVANASGLIRGSKAVTVGLYPENSTTAVWQETFDPYNFIDGILNVGLGNTTPLTEDKLNIAGARFGVDVTGEERLYINLRSVPYAIQSKVADYARTVSTNVLYLDLTSQKVGVGISNPSQKLSVAGVVESTTGGFKFPDATTQTTAFTSALGGDVTGTYPNPTVAKIQGRTVASTAPTQGQALRWNNTSSQWEPTTVGDAVDSSYGVITNKGLQLDGSNNFGLINGSSSGQILRWNNDTNQWNLSVNTPSGNAGGDLTGTYPNPIIATSSITSAKIADGTIINADISTSAAIPFSKLNIVKADIVALGIPTSDTNTTYTAGTGLSLTATTFKIDSTVVTRNYAGTITANAFAGDGSRLTNLPTGTLSDNSVTTAKINGGAVTSDKIADGTIVSADISTSAAIPFSKLNIVKSDIVGLGIPGSSSGGATYNAGTGLTLTGNTFKTDSTVVTRNSGGSIRVNKLISSTITPTGNNPLTITSTQQEVLHLKSSDADFSKIILEAVTNASTQVAFFENGAQKAIVGYRSSTGSLHFSSTETDILNMNINTNRVGIGNASPSSLLSVGSTNAFQVNDAGKVTANAGYFAAGVTANYFAGDGSRLTNIPAGTISDNAVTSAKIVDGTITSADISTSAAIPFSKLNITKSDITGLNIPGSDTNTTYTAGTGLSLTGTTFKIGSSVVTSNYTGTVTATAFVGDGSGLTNLATGTLGDNSVTSAKILDGAIVNADVNDSAAIVYSKLNLSNSLVAADLTTGAITSAKILDGTIAANDVSSAIVTSNYHGTVTATAFSGDGSGLTNVATGTLSDNSVTSAKILDGAIVNGDVNASAGITYSKLNLTGGILNADVNASAAIGYSKLNLSNSLVAADLTTDAVTSAKILDGTIAANDVSSAIVTSNYHGTVTATAFSGDGSALTGISATTVADNSVTSAKILDGAIVNGDVNASAGITYSKLNLTGGILNADVNASAAIGYSKLNLSNSLVAADLTTGAVTSAKILDGTIAANVLKWNGTAWAQSATANYTAGTGISISAAGVITNTGDTNSANDITTSTSGAGDVSGSFPTLSVIKLQNRNVASTAPTNGQILKWNNTITEWQPSSDIGAGTSWGLTGTSGTTYGTSYLGTSDSVTLDIRVNALSAFRLKPASSSTEGPIVLGGYRLNVATANGATIAGGGKSGFLNQVNAQYGTVSGGRGNTASSAYSTVGGGTGNTAGGLASSIPGGQANTAAGAYSFVAGGFTNKADSDYSFVAGSNAQITNASYTNCFVWSDGSTTTSPGAANQFVAKATGGFIFYAPAGATFYTNSGASAGVTVGAGAGSWSTVSDRNAKDNFKAVDTTQVLDKLANIPMQEWNYKAQDPKIRHIGPMAQDVYAAFGLGLDEKHIDTVDADGLSMAAIQGLYKLVKQQETTIKAQQEQLSSLQARLEALEKK
jgi:hypothetical protein